MGKSLRKAFSKAMDVVDGAFTKALIKSDTRRIKNNAKAWRASQPLSNEEYRRRIANFR